MPHGLLTLVMCALDKMIIFTSELDVRCNLGKFVSRKFMRLEGSKIHCSLRDQSLSDLLYNKANGSNRCKTIITII